MSEADFVPTANVNGVWDDEPQEENDTSLLNDWEADHPISIIDAEVVPSWNTKQTYDFDIPDDWDSVELLSEWDEAEADLNFDETESDSWNNDCGDGCEDEDEKEPPTLTQRIQLGGSAAKWKPTEFESLTHVISPVFGQNGLCGFAEGNDCSVVDINENQSAVFTLDWFSPIVDNPYAFGAISAAASFSKLYAIGAKPLTALNIMALPCNLGLESVGDVMKGGSDKVIEAGAFVVGGHSIDDKEPKYGLATFGLAHPNEIIHNDNAQPGDALFLTKPLGTGILERAFQAGLEDDESLKNEIDFMMELNKNASEAMKAACAHAATPVSESGLVGHLRSILEECKAAAQLEWDQIPLFEHVLEHCQNGHVSKRATLIENWAAQFVSITCQDEKERKTRMSILCDPQTSGGLLIAIPNDRATTFEETFEELSGRKPARIGKIVSGTIGTIELLQAR